MRSRKPLGGSLGTLCVSDARLAASVVVARNVVLHHVKALECNAGGSGADARELVRRWSSAPPAIVALDAKAGRSPGTDRVLAGHVDAAPRDARHRKRDGHRADPHARLSDRDGREQGRAPTPDRTT